MNIINYFTIYLILIKLNTNSLKSICIFPHYFNENYIPLYVVLYVKELSNYFDEILIVTNEREISNRNLFNTGNISLLLTKNEGYDFGMFYKGYLSIEPTKYKRIACINDSNILFGKLDFLFEWGNKQQLDFWGILDSSLKPDFSVLVDNYHIQSYFLVFEKNAIAILPLYFKSLNIEEIFNEKHPKILRKKVILVWEIGLSQFIKKMDLKIGTYINNIDFREKYNITKPVNLTLKHYSKLIEVGLPILKKRVILSTNFGHIFTIKNNWARLIKKYGEDDFEITKLLKELRHIRNKHFNNKIKRKIGFT